MPICAYMKIFWNGIYSKNDQNMYCSLFLEGVGQRWNTNGTELSEIGKRNNLYCTRACVCVCVCVYVGMYVCVCV